MMTALLCLCTPAVASTTTLTQDALCTLKGVTQLFATPDGTTQLRLLDTSLSLTLKVEHPQRWQVQVSDGWVGFVDKTVLLANCKLTPKMTAQDAALEPADIPEAYDALKTKVDAAEGADIPQELLESQSATIERVSKARDEVRRAQGELAAPGTHRVAVYDLRLSNIAEGLGRVTTETLLEELRKLDKVTAIGMDEIREILDFEAQRQALGCESDEACFAEIAGALGVDELIVGSLSEEADGRTMVVKRIDQRRAEVVTSFSKRLKVGSGEEFLLTVPDAITALYPNAAYRAGTKRGVSEKELRRFNAPPIPTWVTYSSIGLSIVASGVATYAYLEGQAANDRLNAVQGTAGDTGALDTEAWSPAVESYNRWQNINQIGLYSAGSLALGSIVMAFFTDWLGDGDDESDEENHDAP